MAAGIPSKDKTIRVTELHRARYDVHREEEEEEESHRLYLESVYKKKKNITDKVEKEKTTEDKNFR